MPFIQKVTIENSYRSDHSGLILCVKLDTIESGKGLWKFNNSILSDREYINVLKETINKI